MDDISYTWDHYKGIYLCLSFSKAVFNRSIVIRRSVSSRSSFATSWPGAAATGISILEPILMIDILGYICLRAPRYRVGCACFCPDF